MNTLIGRHCRICRKPGGVAATEALRALGYEVNRHSDDQHAYAHSDCMQKKRRKLASSAKEKK